MRILHIYSGNLYGGIENLLITLAQSQACCPGLNLEFCVCFEGRLHDELKRSAPTYLLNPVRLRKPWTVVAARQKLERLLGSHNYDAIICHSAWCQFIFGPVVRSAGIPLVFSVHDATNGKHWLELLARLVKPDLILSNSLFTADVIRRSYPDVETKSIYWPVASAGIPNPSVRKLKRAEFNTDECQTVIIQVSRMEEWKGHRLHLKALSKLRNKPGWTCWMVGGCQRPHERRYFASITREAEKLGIADRVRFLGQRTDVSQLLYAADIHCQPNTAPEPFGRTFIEALLAGLPVVTTKLGAAVEIVDDSCGVLVEPGNPQALSEALSSMIDNPDWRHNLAQHCIARGKSLCDPKRQVGIYAQTIAGVLAEPVLH